jgi:UDP-3-O-[3-hydroxymyristoyl] glucosamine N-acyltransferase
MKIHDLARALDAQFDPRLDLEITGVATMEEAGPADLTFLSNPKYIAKLKDCQAGAILVSHQFDGLVPIPALRVANSYLAFAKALEIFYTQPQPPRQIHPTAVLGTRVKLGKNVAIAAYVVIGNDVQIGDNVTIYPHCVIYDGAVIGAGSILHSHAVVREHVQVGERVILQNAAVIGADGFGFVPLPEGTLYKIPQVGNVVLENDVEVQVHSAIDRAAIGVTRVGQGTKIDNLVQVGHGCQIGDHTVICAQVTLAGSTKVGNHVMLGAEAGASGHLTIGDRVSAGFNSSILQSVPAGTQVCGYPAMEHKPWLRLMTELKSLPQLMRRVKKLEQHIGSTATASDLPEDSSKQL